MHRVCTTVMVAEAGVPGANVQFKDILVCPQSTDLTGRWCFLSNGGREEL